jgi:hypothetical protein
MGWMAAPSLAIRKVLQANNATARGEAVTQHLMEGCVNEAVLVGMDLD